MIEYGNYYQREDIFFMGLDPLANYDIQKVIINARLKYRNEMEKQRQIVEDECKREWPTDLTDPKIIAWCGLQDRAKEAMKDRYKEFDIKLSPSKHCVVKAFYYQDKKWLYWWDLFDNLKIVKSGLEFFPWFDHPASYLIFATDETQSPLMCTDLFKHVRQYTI